MSWALITDTPKLRPGSTPMPRQSATRPGSRACQTLTLTPPHSLEGRTSNSSPLSCAVVIIFSRPPPYIVVAFPVRCLPASMHKQTVSTFVTDVLRIPSSVVCFFHYGRRLNQIQQVFLVSIILVYCGVPIRRNYQIVNLARPLVPLCRHLERGHGVDCSLPPHRLHRNQFPSLKFGGFPWIPARLPVDNDWLAVGGQSQNVDQSKHI